MEISKVISENLNQWMREDTSLDTLQKVEAKSGIGFGTIRRAKNGDGNITVEKLAAIAEAFGRQPADLLTPEAGNATGPAATTVCIPPPADIFRNASPRSRKIIDRLLAIEQANKTPSALYALLENALELIQPAASKDDYSSLNDLGDLGD